MPWSQTLIDYPVCRQDLWRLEANYVPKQSVLIPLFPGVAPVYLPTSLEPGDQSLWSPRNFDAALEQPVGFQGLRQYFSTGGERALYEENA